MTCMRAISCAHSSVSLTQTHTLRGERDESERSGKAPTISSPVECVTVKYVVAGISVHSCLMLSVLGCFSALFNFNTLIKVSFSLFAYYTTPFSLYFAICTLYETLPALRKSSRFPGHVCQSTEGSFFVSSYACHPCNKSKS